MNINEYLPMFLAESREHLQELNLAVVRVEEDPDDTDTIGEIFRIAHSLKGMSATMGFERIAALTHAMEDLFEVFRQRRGGLDREAIDVLLECLDALSEAFEAIDTEGVERLDEAPLVLRLQALVRTQSEHAATVTAKRPEPGELAVEAGGQRVVHVVARLDEATLMPSVRAFMVFAALSDHGRILASLPPEDATEGFAGDAVEVWLASDHENDVVETAAAGVPDVVEVTVAESDTQGVETQDAGGPEPEADVATSEVATPAVHEKKTAGTSTVRVDSERLDQLMHLMGELVVHRTQLESLLAHAEVPGVQHAMNDLIRTSQALQTMVMQVRMIPVEAVFLRFPRLVRDLSGKLDKKVDLRLTGAETELDRTVVDALGDPLVHLVRNSLDHGLESAAEREAAGKPPPGTLEISARHAGGSVLITVQDDGRGIDPARVARKARRARADRGRRGDTIDLQHAIELLFAAGFSTAEKMSDVSGRGVGLDAVRERDPRARRRGVRPSAVGVGTRPRSGFR